MEEINNLLKKYNNFKYEQIRSVEHLEDGSKIVKLVVQDDDGEDTDTIRIQFSDIKDLRILDASVLSFLDMSSGISLLQDNGLYGFAIGGDTTMLHVHNAPFYIIASDMKILED